MLPDRQMRDVGQGLTFALPVALTDLTTSASIFHSKAIFEQVFSRSPSPTPSLLGKCTRTLFLLLQWQMGVNEFLILTT